MISLNIRLYYQGLLYIMYTLYYQGLLYIFDCIIKYYFIYLIVLSNITLYIWLYYQGLYYIFDCIIKNYFIYLIVLSRITLYIWLYYQGLINIFDCIIKEACFGNFMCTDDQQTNRMDTLVSERVIMHSQTDYQVQKAIANSPRVN